MTIDPLTIATIGIGVLSAGAGAASAHSAAQYKSQVAKMNQQIAEENAARSIQTSQVEAQDQDALTLAALGELTAEQGASGISIGSKSSARARRAVRTMGRLDALRTRQAGEVEAYNYKTDAANFDAERRAAKTEGKFALLQGGLNIASSLIGGAGKTANAGKFGNVGAGRTARIPRARTTRY